METGTKVLGRTVLRPVKPPCTTRMGLGIRELGGIARDMGRDRCIMSRKNLCIRGSGTMANDTAMVLSMIKVR